MYWTVLLPAGIVFKAEEAMARGFVTFLIGIAFVVAGLTGWPSECSRGMTAPGVYEKRGIVLKERTYGYDHWTNQLVRRSGR
jgi:hypothetical protein